MSITGYDHLAITVADIEATTTFYKRLFNVRVGAELAKNGIETRCWYLPLLGEHPAFNRCPVQGDLPVARSLSRRLLGLPFHLDMDAAMVDEVAGSLARVLDMNP